MNQLNESTIIEKIKSHFTHFPEGVVGIGDDAAVLPINSKKSYVITTDLFVENQHFQLEYFSPQDLAHKSLHVNLSDIAAMGAKPLYALLSLAIPKFLNPIFIDQFTDHFSYSCREANVLLIGGDTTASSNGLFINVTIIGLTQTKNLKFRHTANLGDIICVAGNLGDAHLGLYASQHHIPGLDKFKSHFLRPNALIEEGIWLGKQSSVTAMIDISDGLYIDLQRLTKASNLGAELYLENLQPSKELTEGCFSVNLNTEESMLAGGEDYSLLFTIKSYNYKNFLYKFQKKFGYRIVNIGKINNLNEITLLKNKNKIPFSYKAFSHFNEL